MKAIIKKVTFNKETDGSFGKLYSFKIQYDKTTGIYRSKKKDQTHFVEGKEAEFKIEL